MNTWYTNLTFRSSMAIDDDVMFEILETLGKYGASMTRATDPTEGSIGMTVPADDITEALEIAAALTKDATLPHIGKVEIIGLEAMTLETLEAENARPVFPAVVGYAEIAEMAGVSRQRARQFASIEGFPTPVIETAQGPLMAKTSVESWLSRRNTKTGRPGKLVHA